MNLVKFLFVGAIFFNVLGEFGIIPLLAPIRLSDILLGFALVASLVWRVGIKYNLVLPSGFWILASFWIVGILSLVMSGNLSGGVYLLRFIFYSSSFILSYLLISEKYITLENLFLILVAASSIFLLIGFAQLLFYPNLQLLTDFGYDPHNSRLVSTFLDPNFAGAYLNIALLVCLYMYLSDRFRNTQLFKLLPILLTVGIVLTFSRSAYLMMVNQLLFLGLFKSWRIVLLAVLLLFLSSMLIPRIQERVTGGLTVDASAYERFSSWRAGFLVFKDNQIFGVGFNNLRGAFQQKNLLKANTVDGGHAGAGVDSSLVFVLATTGAIGFTAYVSWWLWVLALGYKCSKRKTGRYLSAVLLCLSAGLMVNSQFINSLFYPPIMLVFYSIIGAIYAVSEK